MVEGLNETLRQSAQNYEPDVELLLAASNAIQRLIAERQILRERVMTLEHELHTLRSQAIIVGDSYRKLTDEFVTQFKLIDNAVSNLFREPGTALAASSEDTTVSSSQEVSPRSTAA